MRILICTMLCLVLGKAAAAVDPLFVDPPPDKAHPARMESVRIPTHGATINSVFYLAAGGGSHPTMILLHGFPGNEQNLDLAQAMRRLGWNVLTLHPRGSWGSLGVYTYQHHLEDAKVALDFVRDENNAKTYGIDTKRIVLAGHSTGGFIAANTAAYSAAVAGLILISSSDDSAQAQAAQGDPSKWKAFVDDMQSDCGSPLAACTGEGLGQELLSNAPSWSFKGIAPAIRAIPMLIITADDGLASEVSVIASSAQRAHKIHIATDHPYSDKRITLMRAVADWLRQLK